MNINLNQTTEMKEKVIEFLRKEGLLGEDKTEFVITFPGKEVTVNALIEKFAQELELHMLLHFNKKHSETLKKAQRVQESLSMNKKIYAAVQIGQLCENLRLLQPLTTETELRPQYGFEDDGPLDGEESAPSKKRARKLNTGMGF